MLRLDVSGPLPVAPPDNPRVGNGVADDDFIVAMGLRNPFRFTFRPGTSELWIGDVGWNDWEEINRVPSPLGSVENFGWPCYEGVGEHPTYGTKDLCAVLRAGNPPGMTRLDPFWTYNHSQKVVSGESCGTGSSSITGVAFQTPGAFPAQYDGALFFGDSSRYCIWAMLAGGIRASPIRTRASPSSPRARWRARRCARWTSSAAPTGTSTSPTSTATASCACASSPRTSRRRRSSAQTPPRARARSS